MTTQKDTLEQRLTSQKWGVGKEQTVGVSRDGFADPTGEYPKREYYYGSSISKKSRGSETTSVPVGGSVEGVSARQADKIQSQYPLSQTNETPSGHVIEINDTPGAESITAKHRNGTGIEMLADGSVIVSTKTNRIEVTGGDHSVIVEGDGELIYHGNMSLTVSGDYNLNVGGNYNVNVAGNKIEDLFGTHRKRVGKTYSEVILGDKDERIVGHRASLCLQDDIQAVKGDFSRLVEGNIEIATDKALGMSAKERFSLVSVSGIITANTLSVMSDKGTIGGENVEHYGKMFGGPGEDVGTSGTTFYGTLVGKASEAYTANFAQKADHAHTSHRATHADNAAKALQAGAAVTAQQANETNSPMPAGSAGSYQSGTVSAITADPTYNMTHGFTAVVPQTFMPNAEMVGSILGLSKYGIKNVTIDTPEGDLTNKLIRNKDYNGKTNRTPAPAEVRCLLTDPENLKDTVLTTALVAEGRLNPEFNRLSPKTIRRTAGKNATARFGYTSLGNNPIENKSKRFTPKKSL